MADEDDSVIALEGEVRSPKLALYPIALNGGGVGLYEDPREFGRRLDRRGNVRFAWPAERRGNTAGAAGGAGDNELEIPNANTDVIEEEEGFETIDLEAGSLPQQQLPRTIHHRTSSRLSLATNNPWRIWSTLHAELSRLAAIRTSRAEDESSHATLARQKNTLASSNLVESVYNQDDFDFALVLSCKDAYAFWAKYLDFREEALGFLEEDGSTIVTNTEVEQVIDGIRTPLNSGLRRRKNAVSSDRVQSAKATTPSRSTPFSSMNNSNGISPLPPPSMLRSSQKRPTFHQKSLFERAVDRLSPTRLSLGTSRRDITSAATTGTTTPLRDTPERRDVYSTGGKLRRRWGNQDYDKNGLLNSTPNLTSPPIVSLKNRRMGSTRKTWKGVTSSGKRVNSSRKSRSLFESAERLGKRARETLVDGGLRSTDENEEDNFFNSPGIPRGVGE